MPFITENIEIFIVSILVLIVIFIITFIIMAARYTKLRRSYMGMLKGTNVPDFEKVMMQVHEEISKLQSNQSHHGQDIKNIQSSITKLKSNIGMHRYNAYNQQGSDLSFSLAIVDDYQNGIVLTGLHSREDSYIYAKPLEKGNSTYALSPEEKQAIHQAVNKA